MLYKRYGQVMSGTCVNLAPRPTARCCRWRMTPKPSPVYSESFTMSIFRLLLLLFLILLLKPYNRVHIGAYNRFPEMLLTDKHVCYKQISSRRSRKSKATNKQRLQTYIRTKTILHRLSSGSDIYDQLPMRVVC